MNRTCPYCGDYIKNEEAAECAKCAMIDAECSLCGKKLRDRKMKLCKLCLRAMKADTTEMYRREHLYELQSRTDLKHV